MEKDFYDKLTMEYSDFLEWNLEYDSRQNFEWFLLEHDKKDIAWNKKIREKTYKIVKEKLSEMY